MSKSKIYTRDEAARIVELFEVVLDKYGITIPSPDDDQRESDNDVALYGTTYWDLVDDVESALIKVLGRQGGSLEDVVSYEFSGRF